ncbi:hypothetical protein C1Y12_10455 [Pseudomonas sp. FW305-47B]|nr:hypothetical protein C1Y12_10455 [Pseudomonas sp. FW305-47B]PMX58436.1 hypothetical protein C1Y13_21005 [Pseudomonas sp. FW305-33]
MGVVDVNGNPSDTTELEYEDTTAPEAPVVGITDNGDGTLTIAGSGEPGATVNVTFPDGSTGSVVVDASGNYSIDSPAGVGQPNGDVVVTLTDGTGNLSEETVVAYEDTSAPEAPVVGITDNGDGTLTIAGSGEPGATVNVTFPDGSTGSVVVNAEGDYSIDSPAGVSQPNGEVVVSATDINGNHSENTVVAYDDTRVPEAPVVGITDNGDGTLTISGRGEPGATVNVTLPDGSFWDGALFGIVVDAAGNYSFTSPEGKIQPNGEIVVNVTDVNGNLSENTVEVYVDSIKPAAPTVLFTNNGDGTITITAYGEPGATVNVTFPDGSTGSVGPSGGYTLTSPAGVPQPEGNLVVSLTDINGNTSDDTVVFVDIVAPDAPAFNALAGILDHGSPVLSGMAEAGATIIIYDNGSEIDRVIVAEDGSWSYTPSPALSDGVHQLSVEAVDGAGNVSVRTEQLIEVDSTAPTQTASITFMTKDSGSVRTDFNTHDGSAGRLIQGKLSAALSGHERLQMSTDGGATWVDAVVNGLDWVLQDLNSHAGNWSIQTRVVDSFGREGVTTSTAVTVDATAPTAPTTLTRQGGDLYPTYQYITVDGLADPSVRVGDKVVLVGDTFRLEHIVTSAEKTAGKVNIDVLQSSKYSVQIVDIFGNASAFKHTAETSSLMTNFEIDAKAKVVVNGPTALSIGIVTSSEGYVGVGARYGVTPGGGATGLYFGSSLSSSNTGWAEITLARYATRIYFPNSLQGLPGSGTSVRLEYYDTEGVMRYSFSPTTGASTPPTFDTGGVGAPIASIKIISTAEFQGFNIVSMVFNWAPRGDENPIENILSDVGYQGTAADDTFNISFVDGFTGSVDGNGGTDVLQIKGALQTFDLTALGNKMSSVEVIDITGTGDNTLKLSLGDVLGQGSMDLFHASGDVQMMVKGNAGDVVMLDDLLPNGMDPGDWANTGSVDVGGVTYASYQHSTMDAELLVQQGVTVNLV